MALGREEGKLPLSPYEKAIYAHAACIVSMQHRHLAQFPSGGTRTEQRGDRIHATAWVWRREFM